MASAFGHNDIPLQTFPYTTPLPRPSCARYIIIIIIILFCRVYGSGGGYYVPADYGVSGGVALPEPVWLPAPSIATAPATWGSPAPVPLYPHTTLTPMGSINAYVSTSSSSSSSSSSFYFFFYSFQSAVSSPLLRNSTSTRVAPTSNPHSRSSSTPGSTRRARPHARRRRSPWRAPSSAAPSAVPTLRYTHDTHTTHTRTRDRTRWWWVVVLPSTLVVAGRRECRWRVRVPPGPLRYPGHRGSGHDAGLDPPPLVLLPIPGLRRARLPPATPRR
jgi:hypothetical protein